MWWRANWWDIEYLSGDVGITVIDLRTDEILVYDEVVNSED